AAFLNSHGGTLVIGLKDDGEILGLDNDLKTLSKKQDLDGWALSFTQTVTNYLGTDVAAVIELAFTEVEGHTIAVASCQPHGQPVFMQDGDKVDLWVRAGNSSRALNVLETSKYIQQRWPSGVSSEMVPA
ncbi:MAG: ATP-binding protein, partial [Solirubrobacterales bacterium]|nr:ATP-binding protein [Solirubrobacterales bacterium]